MRKRFLVRELVMAALLLALNAGLVGFYLGLDSSAIAGPVQYETDVADGCENGTDDDGDGAVDCGDSDCVGIAPCVAPAPALGPGGLLVGALLLLGVGAAGLALRRRDQE